MSKYYFFIIIFLHGRDPIRCMITIVGNRIFANYETPNRIFAYYSRQSRLRTLKDISYRNSNRILILAFVERWQQETNAFHMSFSEMTSALDDVPIFVAYRLWVDQ